jgi:NADPH2:quinone reductase
MKMSVKHTRIIVTHYGGPDALQVAQEKCPEPKAGEVRVRVLAAGVSLPDLMMREGIHPETPPLPFRVGVGENKGVGRGRESFLGGHGAEGPPLKFIG